MLHLDGRSFSGSWTIVRFGVPLAAPAGQDLNLTHIRARRDPPGLWSQHRLSHLVETTACL
jgi:RNA 3'-terminal phosphate cyclase